MEIFFYKGKENVISSDKVKGLDLGDDSNLKKIKDSFLKVLDNNNL